MVASAAAVPIAQQNVVALLVLLLATHAARHARPVELVVVGAIGHRRAFSECKPATRGGTGGPKVQVGWRVELARLTRPLQPFARLQAVGRQVKHLVWRAPLLNGLMR